MVSEVLDNMTEFNVKTLFWSIIWCAWCGAGLRGGEGRCRPESGGRDAEEGRRPRKNQQVWASDSCCCCCCSNAENLHWKKKPRETLKREPMQGGTTRFVVFQHLSELFFFSDCVSFQVSGCWWLDEKKNSHHSQVFEFLKKRYGFLTCCLLGLIFQRKSCHVDEKRIWWWISEYVRRKCLNRGGRNKVEVRLCGLCLLLLLRIKVSY